MKAHASQSLFSYWNSLRGDRLAPRRFEIEPSSIAPFLPDTFILERLDQDAFRFRLAGTRISDAFGLELRGANLLELFAISDHPLLRREIALVTSQGAAALFEIKAGEAGAPAGTFEMLILPLTHTRDRVDRLLGSIAPVDKPDWLGTVPLATRKVLRSEIIWPDGQPRSIVERQAPFSPVVREARIVRSDRRQFRVYDGGLSRNDGS